ncbi:hypothetical protein FHR90_003102 [Endobacter medicaginis]|uniref:Uncharacterized protein n=1 Tax=Endobacter medicaginis TaxID=1181271 RepID=A0A850NJ93_9PROT|nr:hypothetical protein [Endobacter medicaginis]MBB3175248.1 hypothetical protein [Endobacter medicaginis]MCX5476268.1 hypothetical protein [Endobacter medicaginis]NVN28974.1 hypothetical protein [Endobacter medicaginis]
MYPKRILCPRDQPARKWRKRSFLSHLLAERNHCDILCQNGRAKVNIFVRILSDQKILFRHTCDFGLDLVTAGYISIVPDDDLEGWKLVLSPEGKVAADQLAAAGASAPA